MINYTETPDWDAKVRELIDGRGVDCIVEIGGPGTIAISLKALAVGGHLSLIGASLAPRHVHQRHVRSDAGAAVGAQCPRVAFDDATVAELSPMRHLDRLRAPLVVAYGTCESPEFQRQNREFAAALP